MDKRRRRLLNTVFRSHVDKPSAFSLNAWWPPTTTTTLEGAPAVLDTSGVIGVKLPFPWYFDLLQDPQKIENARQQLIEQSCDMVLRKHVNYFQYVLPMQYLCKQIVAKNLVVQASSVDPFVFAGWDESTPLAFDDPSKEAAGRTFLSLYKLLGPFVLLIVVPGAGFSAMRTLRSFRRFEVIRDIVSLVHAIKAEATYDEFANNQDGRSDDELSRSSDVSDATALIHALAAFHDGLQGKDATHANEIENMTREIPTEFFDEQLSDPALLKVLTSLREDRYTFCAFCYYLYHQGEIHTNLITFLKIVLLKLKTQGQEERNQRTIETMRRRIRTLVRDLEEAQDKLGDVQDKLGTRETRNAELQRRIAEIEAQHAELQSLNESLTQLQASQNELLQQNEARLQQKDMMIAGNTKELHELQAKVQQQQQNENASLLELRRKEMELEEKVKQSRDAIANKLQFLEIFVTEFAAFIEKDDNSIFEHMRLPPNERELHTIRNFAITKNRSSETTNYNRLVVFDHDRTGLFRTYYDHDTDRLRTSVIPNVSLVGEDQIVRMQDGIDRIAGETSREFDGLLESAKKKIENETAAALSAAHVLNTMAPTEQHDTSHEEVTLLMESLQQTGGTCLVVGTSDVDNQILIDSMLHHAKEDVTSYGSFELHGRLRANETIDVQTWTDGHLNLRPASRESTQSLRATIPGPGAMDGESTGGKARTADESAAEEEGDAFFRVFKLEMKKGKTIHLINAIATPGQSTRGIKITMTIDSTDNVLGDRNDRIRHQHAEPIVLADPGSAFVRQGIFEWHRMSGIHTNHDILPIVDKTVVGDPMESTVYVHINSTSFADLQTKIQSTESDVSIGSVKAKELCEQYMKRYETTKTDLTLMAFFSFMDRELRQSSDNVKYIVYKRMIVFFSEATGAERFVMNVLASTMKTLTAPPPIPPTPTPSAAPLDEEPSDKELSDEEPSEYRSSHASEQHQYTIVALQNQYISSRERNTLFHEQTALLNDLFAKEVPSKYLETEAAFTFGYKSDAAEETGSSASWLATAKTLMKASVSVWAPSLLFLVDVVTMKRNVLSYLITAQSGVIVTLVLKNNAGEDEQTRQVRSSSAQLAMLNALGTAIELFGPTIMHNTGYNLDVSFMTSAVSSLPKIIATWKTTQYLFTFSSPAGKSGHVKTEEY